MTAATPIRPRRRNDLPPGLADRDYPAVLAPASVERALRVEATISVGAEKIAQALQQIGRAASATQPL